MNRKFVLKKLFVLVTVFILLFGNITAQQRTHLPYSIFGIGELVPKGFSRNMGMGKSGIALSSDKFLNNMNPASYHKLDSVSFFFDFGLSGDYVKYKDKSDTQYGNDVNIKNIAFGFRMNRNWAGSFGISPYSAVGYKISTEVDLEGTQDMYDVVLTGSGGLNQFYFDNSYVIFDKLSLGINASFIFGNTEKSEVISSEVLSYDIEYLETSYLSKLILDFGFQYFFTLKNKTQIIIGGIAGNKHKLNFREEVTISQVNGAVYEDDSETKDPFSIPMYFGGGISVVIPNKLTLSADYLFNNWSRTSSDNWDESSSNNWDNSSSNNADFKFRNTNAIKLGAEYIPGALNQFGYLGRISYRAGLYHEGSYLKLNGKKNIADNGFSLGVGIPFPQNKTSLNIAYNYGIYGTTENGLMKKSYSSLFVSLTLHDWWFIKRKYD